MKKDWTKNTLPDISENLDSRRIPITKGKREGGKYPYYGASGIVDYVSEYLFDEDILLISEDGANLLARSTPIAFSVSGKVWVNNHAHILKFKNMCTQRLVEYFFAYKDISDYVTGAAQPKLSQKNLNLIQIPLPPLSEQKEIVEYLDSSFAKIDKLKENAAKNLEEAKALFQSALKDALEPKEGWEEKTLPDISENLDSRRIPITKGKRDSGKYPYYGASGIVDYVGDYIFDEDILLLSEDGANLLARSTPIAFSVSGKVWVNNHAHILKFKDMCTQRFVEYFFASKDISEYVTGAAQPKLSQKKMNIIPISIPSLSEQQSIVSYLDSLNDKVNTLQQNYSRICDECDALKQAILRQVFE